MRMCLLVVMLTRRVGAKILSLDSIAGSRPVIDPRFIGCPIRIVISYYCSGLTPLSRHSISYLRDMKEKRHAIILLVRIEGYRGKRLLLSAFLLDSLDLEDYLILF